MVQFCLDRGDSLMQPGVLASLETAGLDGWRQLAPLLEQRYADTAHGDMASWRRAVEDLPAVTPGGADFDADTIHLLADPLPDALLELVRKSLLALSPWRKGPFDIGGIHIDSEWRSDWKWNRVRSALAPLDGRLILDVGCGNGYYALRMLGAGARAVVGIDPTLLFCMQFRALLHFLPDPPVHVLPLRLDELPARCHAFDTTFSMGVLYHQRSPLGHLKQLLETLRPGGELVLETLILPGGEQCCRTPPDRYARMRNVWLLPSLPELLVWLQRTGFNDCRVADVTATTTHEQRTTEWMPFESLAEALAPDDPDRTVEGWPAPRRAVVICRSP
ncbi:MAG: tRNA 5-methoxyuridine(34)/uridine 5-oxyacetic acid(34) synthase CmoB [Woeseia sp.]